MGSAGHDGRDLTRNVQVTLLQGLKQGVVALYLASGLRIKLAVCRYAGGEQRFDIFPHAFKHVFLQSLCYVYKIFADGTRRR